MTQAPYSVYAVGADGLKYRFCCSTRPQAMTLARNLVFPRLAEPMSSSEVRRHTADGSDFVQRFSRDGVSV
jgi:hypothetical protein